MLRLTVRRLSISTNTLNSYSSTCTLHRNGSFTLRNNGRAYCNSRFASYNETPKQQGDRAVAIFEKIAKTDALINLLSGEISTELRNNIILNPDPKSKLRHIEITEDKIRLEYSQVTEQFTVRRN